MQVACAYIGGCIFLWRLKLKQTSENLPMRRGMVCYLSGGVFLKDVSKESLKAFSVASMSSP